MSEQMTKRERVQAVFHNEEVDRVPAFLPGEDSTTGLDVFCRLAQGRKSRRRPKGSWKSAEKRAICWDRTAPCRILGRRESAGS